MADGIEIPVTVPVDGGGLVTLDSLAAKVLELEDATRRLASTQSKAKEESKGWGAVMTGVIAGISTAVTQRAIRAVDDLTASFSAAVAEGGHLADLSAQFNTSAESLQKLREIGAPVGVGLETIARSMNLVNRTMAKSGPAFRKYGLDVQALAKLDSAQRFEEIAKAIAKIQDPNKQAAASFELLKDRSGALLKVIRSDFQKAREDAVNFGLVMKDNVVAALDEFGDKKDLFEKVLGSLGKNLLGVVASSKPLQEAFRIVIELVGSLSKWIQDNQKTIIQWVDAGVIFAAEALVTLTKAIDPTIEGLRVLAQWIIDAAEGFAKLAAVAGAAKGVLSGSVSFGVAFAELKDQLHDINKLFDGQRATVDGWAATAKQGAAAAESAIGKLRDRIVNANGTMADFTLGTKAAGGALEEIDPAAKKAAEAIQKLREELLGLVDPKEITKLEGALKGIDVSKIKDDELAKIGPQLEQASKQGIILSDVAVRVIQRWLPMKETKADIEGVNAALKEQADIAASIVGKLGDENAIREAFRMFGEGIKQAFGQSLDTLDFSQIGTEQLDNIVKRLREIQLAARDQKVEVLPLQEALAEAWRVQQERLGPVPTRLKEAEKGAFDFGAALDIAAKAAQALGQTSLGGFLGGLITATQQAFALAEQVKKTITDAKGFSNLDFKGKAGVLSAGLGTAVGIFNANRQSSALGGAFSGASQGAAFGSAFGPTGAVVGALAGGLIGFFAGSKYRRIAKEAGKTLGTELSKELIDKIEKDAKKLGISIKNAALVNLPAAMAESGKAAATFSKQIDALMTGIANKSIPAEQGIAALGESFSKVADEALKAGRVGDRTMVGLLKRARELKIESPEMKAFVGEQLDSAVEGIHKFVNAVSVLNKEWLEWLKTSGQPGGAADSIDKTEASIRRLGETSGTVFGAVFSALVSERGITAAVDALKDDFGKLQEALTQTLGKDEMERVLGPFGAAFATLGDEKLKPIFEGIDGITQAMKGLANAGFLTTDQFTAMQKATSDLFDSAIAGGADMKTALLAVAPGIQSAIKAAEQFGVPLDADTQRLKDLAEQNGITFATDPQAAMLDVLVSIAEVLGADIPESAKRAKQSLEDLKNTVPSEINVSGGGTTGGTSGQRGPVNAQINVNLGIDENPLKAADTAAQMRKVTVEWAADAIEDRLPAIVAALENA